LGEHGENTVNSSSIVANMIDATLPSNRRWQINYLTTLLDSCLFPSHCLAADIHSTVCVKLRYLCHKMLTSIIKNDTLFRSFTKKNFVQMDRKHAREWRVNNCTIQEQKYYFLSLRVVVTMFCAYQIPYRFEQLNRNYFF
jgi:hypothetical protein